MPSRPEKAEINLNVDRNNLYREDSVTDVKVAAIRRLTPIKVDGSDDDSRDPIFMGQTQLMSPSGPLLLQSLLEARTLEEAMDKFPAAMQKEVEKAMAQAEKNHKEKAE
ncbi:MAG: cytoplasmic protein [Desulfobacteraceae bacterium]|jgi:hypothetical protein|nr:cytoplasmic protein [Desulfobacteraceae bacterium]MDH3575739.1 cytoplasmic protein [Desulfobacteraceae bacterium]MDH3723070.1 cytoplasmic protein [Desulfobacteraceae bacterium]MDH3837976.1 cytoplasmic protein [Desulfobacteraceae bacterium]MDH3875113.1 cytoplasmic protein [Desulfobacteraceae bacterium]